MVQEQVFRFVLEGKKRGEIEDYISLVKKDIKSSKYPLIDIGFPKPWTEREYKGKTVYHIESAKYSNEHLGTNFKAGSRFYVLYVKSVKNLPKTSAIAFDKNTILPEIEIDWDKQIKVLIDNKVEKIFDALGWKKNIDQKDLSGWY